MLRLAIVTTHPIQYQVPWFRALSSVPGIDLTVLFATVPDSQQQGEGFGVEFQWDIPLLDGYRYEVLPNVARTPGVDHFQGCDTPTVGQVLQQGRYDAVIVNGWVVKTCLQALWACRRLAIPCLVRGESNHLRPRARWKRLLHRLLLSQYAACLYIGQANRAFYQANGMPNRKLFFVPYGVDNQRFANAARKLAPQRAALHQAWGIQPQAMVVLFCAKFIAKKRPMDLLQALELLQQTSGPPVHLLMVGTGELLEACQIYASQHRLPVSFAGFLNQSEIPTAYVAADVQVLPSDDGETWGLVINEGMACGLPAVVSDQVGCQADLVQPGITGDVFPLGDVAAMAACLGRLAADPSKRAAMAVAARQRVDGYGIEQMVAGTVEALAAVSAAR
jgi:glycosyltransferase involved in cell wall biosynthesis